MEDKAHERAADHRIFQDILNQNENRDLAAPEQFQNHDRRYVVDRNHDRHHHRRQQCSLLTEHAGCQRNAEQDEIAAVNRLDDNAAPLIFLYQTRNHSKQNRLQKQHADNGDCHQTQI